MTRRTTLLSGASQAALTAGLAIVITGAAQAQTAATPAEAPVRLPTVTVESTEPPNTLERSMGLGRLPGRVQDIPQTINVVPREILEQQNVTTVDQALRNVPGITASIGEGNGGVNGDQFRIRGFSSQNDLYVDGLRDFGTYTRDPFNLETVSVVKGPSASTFGQNTVGGAVNLTTRTPFLGSLTAGSISAGMGPLFRGTIDVNRQINDTTAVRLNLMGHFNRVEGRDEVESGRFGVAPSIAFGLGTDTTLTVDYLHLEDRRVPDYGVPIVTAPGATVGRPVTEYGVRRSNWYGWDLDRDNVVVDRVTARLQHKATDWLTLYNDTRFGFATRDFAASPTSCGGSPLFCADALFDSNPATVPRVQASGAGSPFHQETWGVQNVTTAVARFTTGPFRHETTVGLDAWVQNDERTGFSYDPSARPVVSLLDPDHSAAGFGIVPSTSSNAVRKTEQRYLGAFLIEQMWLTPQLSVIGGLRLSNYDIEYTTYGGGAAPSVLSSSPTFVDPRASLVFQPTPSQTYYFSYATSTSPPGSFITTQPGSFNAGNSALDPEKNTIYEIGAKVSLLDGNRLGLYGSLFRVEKGNAFVADPLTGDVTQSGDEQRVQGVELGVTGLITPNWLINANYTYLDSETTRSSTPANIGRRVQFVPRHAASLWTTYEMFRDTPYNVTVGGGFTYRSQAFLNAGNTAEVPSSFSLDAMLAHSFGDRNQWRVAVNAYNLTDELNYDALFGNRVVPSPGRTVIFTLSAAY